jgi:hypothetical protein
VDVIRSSEAKRRGPIKWTPSQARPAPPPRAGPSHLVSYSYGLLPTIRPNISTEIPKGIFQMF